MSGFCKLAIETKSKFFCVLLKTHMLLCSDLHNFCREQDFEISLLGQQCKVNPLQSERLSCLALIERGILE